MVSRDNIALSRWGDGSSNFTEIRELSEAGEEEAGPDDQDCGQDHEGLGPQIVPGRLQGKVAQVKEEKPKKPAAKSMMEMLRETAESSK